MIQPNECSKTFFLFNKLRTISRQVKHTNIWIFPEGIAAAGAPPEANSQEKKPKRRQVFITQDWGSLLTTIKLTLFLYFFNAMAFLIQDTFVS